MRPDSVEDVSLIEDALPAFSCTTQVTWLWKGRITCVCVCIIVYM